jgi:hypothetical protein
MVSNNNDLAEKVFTNRHDMWVCKRCIELIKQSQEHAKEARKLKVLREYRDVVDDFRIALGFGGIETLFATYSVAFNDIAHEFVKGDQGIFCKVRRNYIMPIMPIVFDGQYFFLHLNFRKIQALEKWYLHIFRFGEVNKLTPNTDFVGHEIS